MYRPSAFPTQPGQPDDDRTAERGQLLVVFALALVAVIGMVGLIIDGGDTFLQRRDQQNVSDAAAMAAGYALVNGQDPTAAAQAVASANGYTHGQNGAVVTVTVGSSAITVDVARPHRNYFAGVMGFATWDVSATASVAAGLPNTATGAMPLIFNESAFEVAGNKCKAGNACTPATFDQPGSGSQDVPQTNASFNWTVFCTANGNPCNANTNDVDDIINDGADATITLNMEIGPLNAGSHTALFNSLAGKVGKAYPVVFVDNTGAAKGWAMFYLSGSVGGSTKQISGWFEDQKNAPPLKITPNGGNAQGTYGAYSVKLTN